MTVLLSAAAALLSLLILPGWSFWFDVIPKIVVLLLSAALTCVLFRDWGAFQNPRVKAFGWLAVMQAAALILAAAFSTHPQISILGSTWRRSGLIPELAVLIIGVAAAAHFSMNRDSSRIFICVTALAAIPACIYAVAQYFGIDPWISAAGYHAGEGPFKIVRPPSTLGHADYFATYLLYAISAGVTFAFSEKAKDWKITGLMIACLGTFTLVLTGTRAALVGLAGGIVWLALKQRIPKGWFGGGIAMLVLLGAFYLSPAGALLRARVHWSSEDTVGGGRPLLWRDTARMARTRLFHGFGDETFALEFPRFQSIELGRSYPDFYQESPHNIFLDALVSRGILGLFALMALACFGLMLAKGPVGAGFVAILISQQFSSFTLPTQLYFFFSLAILVARAGPVTATSPGRPSWWGWPVAIPFACFAVYIATGDALLASARRAVDRGDVQAAAAAINHAGQWNAEADIYFSRRFLALKGDDPQLRRAAWQGGLDAARHAIATADDRQNAFVNLAAFYAAENNPVAVELTLRQAIAVAPNWFKPHWLLAQVLDLEGRKQEAQAEAIAAMERDGGKHSEVAQVINQLRR